MKLYFLLRESTITQPIQFIHYSVYIRIFFSITSFSFNLLKINFPCDAQTISEIVKLFGIIMFVNVNNADVIVVNSCEFTYLATKVVQQKYFLFYQFLFTAIFENCIIFDD